MIISRTPFRMSFFGGGTDYPAWYREHGGAVLTTTFNRYCYLTCRFLPPFFEHKSRIVWSKIELVNDTDQISHPVISAALEHVGIAEGIEIHHQGDLPSRSGLGSSSSFTVGLLNILYALKNKATSKGELAKEAIYLEQTLLKENVGVQDQIQTAHGGFNQIVINPDDSFKVMPINISSERMELLNSHIMLFYTGVSRIASEVAKEKIGNIPNMQTELKLMHEMVGQAVQILQGNGDLLDFGKLLNETWQIKRSLSDSLAPGFVNDIYEAGIEAGAVGGKLLGAGGGGFMMFFIEPWKRQLLLDRLDELLWVPITFETEGTQIIFNSEPTYSRTSHSKRDFTKYGLLNGNKN